MPKVGLFELPHWADPFDTGICAPNPPDSYNFLLINEYSVCKESRF